MEDKKSEKANTQYKDRLFRYIFGAKENREHLLALCNAIAGTSYEDAYSIEITTLEDAIYIRMKNDLSFLLRSQMNLYEHQSSVNPNMPLRGFQYCAELYASYIERHELNIYSRKLQKIPTPRYIVFYNGTEERPEVGKLRLSDAFQIPDDSGEFEWTATVLNINYGHNREIMEKCKALEEYAQFIFLVRENQKEMDLKASIDAAVDAMGNAECIGAFLRKNKSEVSAMLLTEFNQTVYERDLREEGWLEGRAEGRRSMQCENVHRMKELGFPTERIAEILGMSVAEVEEILR